MSPPDLTPEPQPLTSRPELTFTPAPKAEKPDDEERRRINGTARDRILNLLRLVGEPNETQIEGRASPEKIRQLRENKDREGFSSGEAIGARRVVSAREILFGTLETVKMTVWQKLEMWAKFFKKRRKRMSEAVGLISSNVAGALDVLAGTKPPLKIAPPVPA